jgi:hypothetical protein
MYALFFLGLSPFSFILPLSFLNNSADYTRFLFGLDNKFIREETKLLFQLKSLVLFFLVLCICVVLFLVFRVLSIR